jgi:hypothetical protein
MLLEHRF